jgi:hypothetical protein
MVQLTTEQRTFVVIKPFYENYTLQQARVAFGLIHFINYFHFPTVEQCDLTANFYLTIMWPFLQYRYGLKNVS